MPIGSGLAGAGTRDSVGASIMIGLLAGVTGVAWLGLAYALARLWLGSEPAIGSPDPDPYYRNHANPTRDAP